MHGPHSSSCCVALCIVCFVSFYVLFVCKCVLYFYHRVTTQLQSTNISYLIYYVNLPSPELPPPVVSSSLWRNTDTGGDPGLPTPPPPELTDPALLWWEEWCGWYMSTVGGRDEAEDEGCCWCSSDLWTLNCGTEGNTILKYLWLQNFVLIGSLVAIDFKVVFVPAYEGKYFFWKVGSSI